MWSPEGITRRAALLGLLAVAACGLTPVYGPDGADRRLFGRIRPQDPETFEDFAFNRRLAERLGPEADGALQLEYRLSIGVVSQAITPEEVTTRYSLNGTADFALRDAAGVVLVQGRVSGFTSYSTTETTIATLTAEADARQRLAQMLADQVVTRLLAASDKLPQ